MVSEIVFGGDPVPRTTSGTSSWRSERGLNYLDTAPAYGQGKSEEGYAEVLRAVGRRPAYS